MLVYNPQFDIIGILQTVNGKELVKIYDDANVFMAFLEYNWIVVGEL